MAKFFVNPFAVAGDRSAIPDTVPLDNSINYETGYGPDYQGVYGTDPTAKAVARRTFNELMYDATDAIKQYQTHGFPDFITSSDNLGSPFPYDIYAIVRYNPGTGMQLFQSKISSNTDTPPSVNWQSLGILNQILVASVAFGIGSTQAVTTTPNTVNFNFSDTSFNSTAAWWNAGSHAMVPTVAGYFDINISIPIEFAVTLPNSDFMVLQLWKNGSLYRTLDRVYAGSISNSGGESDNAPYLFGCTDVIANGSTDYFQAVAYLTAGSTRLIGNAGDGVHGGQFQMIYRGTP